jgi:outer membrane protein assembly factor BamB
MPIGKSGAVDTQVLRAFRLVDGTLSYGQAFQYALVSGLQAVRHDLLLVTLSSTDFLKGEGKLLALSETDQERWRWTADVQRVSAPAVAGETVYFTVDTHTLVRLDLASGEEQGRVHVDANAASAAPLVLEGEVYIPCRGSQVLAVTVQGDVRWRFELDADEMIWLDTTPVALGEHLFTVSNRGQVLALARTDGALQWQVNVGPAGKPLSALATDGEGLYVGARDGLYALDPVDGHEVWHYRTERSVEASPIVHHAVVYVTCHDHYLYALDAVSGQELWSYEVGRRIELSPVLATCGANGPCVIVADRGGTLTALARPLSAAEHEDAGHWLAAAQLRKALGQQERAAEDYEKAGAWAEAARLWEALGRPLRQATALEHQIAAHPARTQVCAKLWDRVAELYAGMWQPEQALNARREAALCRGEPFITVDVEHAGLVVDTETYLQFTVRNEGRGTAQHLVIRAIGEGFAGGIRETQHLLTLPPGQTRKQWLHVCPQRMGDHVQLQFSLEYQGPAGEPHARQQVLAFPVAATAQLRQTVIRRSIMPALSFVDLEIRLFARQRWGYPVEFTLNGEQVFPRGHLSAEILPWISTGYREEDGNRLFEALVADPALHEAWGTISSHEHLRLRLRIDLGAAELHDVPWELLCVDDILLSANAATPFSRYLPATTPWKTDVTARSLRVLVAISNPVDLEEYRLLPLNVEAERTLLEQVLADQDVQMDVLEPPVTLPRLEAKLREGYHILHYVGHGAVGQERGEPVLYLQREDDRAALVKGRQVSAMLARQGVRPYLVILAACESATVATEDVYVALGPQLIQRGMPAVVSMRGKISQASARTFSRTLYERLLAHGVVDLAMNEARSTLVTAERPDAAVPVLFLRLKDGRLWQRKDQVREEPQQHPVFDQRGQQIGIQVNVAGDYHASPAQSIRITGDGNVIGDHSSSHVVKSGSADTAEPGQPNTALLHRRLRRLDSVEIESLCLDDFPEVYDKFARGLQRGEMINLLLDHCRRHPEEANRLNELLK